MSITAIIIATFGFIITSLVGIVAYFSGESLKEQKANTLAIRDLQVNGGISKTELKNMNERCKTHRESADKELEKHSEILSQHETKIAILNQTVGIK